MQQRCLEVVLTSAAAFPLSMPPTSWQPSRSSSASSPLPSRYQPTIPTIMNTTNEIFSQTFFLSRTHQPEYLVVEMSYLKEMTRAHITSDIQLTSAWVLCIYSLAGLAAILGSVGTFKKIPSLVNFFAHIFWGRFVFDSIAFFFLVKHPDMSRLELMGFSLAVLTWNAIGFYFYTSLAHLWGQLLEERPGGFYFFVR